VHRIALLGAAALLPAVLAALAVAGAPDPLRSAAFTLQPLAALLGVAGGLSLALAARRAPVAALGAAAAVAAAPPIGRLLGWPGAPAFPDEPTAQPALRLHFPLAVPGHVLHGGPTAATNPHRYDAARRFAVDVQPSVDAPGALVRSPAAGRVVAVSSGAPDDGPGAARPGRCSLGNHLVIRQQDGVHVVIAHFRADARLPPLGATLAAGDPLGPLGRSGHTGPPHLHLHAQSGPPGQPRVYGLPFAFTAATHLSGPGGPLPVGAVASPSAAPGDHFSPRAVPPGAP
jgi:murein DD-endopeptidase MepM/ murein hydrolase activator NlpD